MAISASPSASRCRLSITGAATLQLTSSTLQRVQPERDVEFEFRSVRQRASRHVKVSRDKLSPVEAARLANQRYRERAWLPGCTVRSLVSWHGGLVVPTLLRLRRSLFSYLLGALLPLSLSLFPSLHPPRSFSVSSSISPFLLPALFRTRTPRGPSR